MDDYTDDSSKESWEVYKRKYKSSDWDFWDEFDFENIKIGQTNTGRNYVIIPTKSIVSGQGKKVELNQKSLVFEDKNKWYIVNINERNKHILKELYSDFKDVNID